MAQIFSGRFTAQVDTPFVVFLIGMRVNQFGAFSQWLPVAQAMPKMLKTLYQHPEKGFLGGEHFFRLLPLSTLLVSYWRSFEDLEQFARNPADPHLSAWQRFTRTVGSDGSVGIWHETYVIEPQHYEALYANMPAFGLAAATHHVPITKQSHSARSRISSRTSDSSGARMT